MAHELARQFRRVTVEPVGFALELLGDRNVEAHALAREKIFVDRFVHERVPEPVCEAVGLGDEHLVRDRVAEALVQLGFGDVGDRGHESVVGGTADDRQDPQRALRRFRERVDAREHDVAQGLGQRVGAELLRREELLCEERVAVRAVERARNEIRLRNIAPDRGDQLRDLVAVEAGQIDARDRTRALELGEHRPQRVPPVQVIATERADDQHARVTQVAGEEHEEVTRGVIGPVQVLEEQQRRDAVAEANDRAEQVLEQRRPAVAGVVAAVVQLGEKPGQRGFGVADDGGLERGIEVPVRVAQRLHDRPEGQRPVHELHARARGDQATGFPHPGGELGDEPGLADAGFAADQVGGRALFARRGLEGCDEHIELGLPADEPGARDARCHAVDCANSSVLGGPVLPSGGAAQAPGLPAAVAVAAGLGEAGLGELVDCEGVVAVHGALLGVFHHPRSA